MNTISSTIKNTFTYFEQTVSFIWYLTVWDCMGLLHSYSHHLLTCKEGIAYSQALRYNMIVSHEHILQEELNNATRILLACLY